MLLTTLVYVMLVDEHAFAYFWEAREAGRPITPHTMIFTQPMISRGVVRNAFI
jgi:hypothetical protein